MNVSTNTRSHRARRRASAVAAGVLALSAVLVAPTPTQAVPNAVTVLADFEGGLPGTYFSYNGNGAGVGYGVETIADTGALARPGQVGDNNILSVGFDVPAGGFGGFGENFGATSQDWSAFDGFSFWFHGTGGGATFQAEIFDDGANADAAERYDVDFTDDTAGWRLIEIPFSSFTAATDFNPNPGNGVLDLATVWGYVFPINSGNDTVKFDDIALYETSPPPPPVTVLADFEGGLPGTYFSYNGNGAGVGYGVETIADTGALARPGQVGDNNILSVGFDVPAGGFGGFGENFGATSQDWSAFDGFSFWFHGTGGGATFQAEIFDDGANADAAERYDVDFTDDTAGWRLIEIPFSSFTAATDFNPNPGNGVLDLATVWGYVFPINSGNDTVKFDDIALYGTTAPPTTTIDDFESGLPFGGAPCPAGGLPLGFCTFNGAGSSVALANPATPPAPDRPGASTPNSVLQMDVDVTSFAGFIHGFSDAGLTTWIPQDWSTSEGISFWMHGSGSGTAMFIDILDNRNPGSTTDDAERFTVPFADDFSGWQLLEFPFTSFARKEIGNGAPNDGLGLFEMHGYAIGALGTGGPQTYYFDDVSLYGVAEPPALAVNFATQNTFIDEGTTGVVAVKLNRPMGPNDPAQVSIDYATERSYATPGEEYTPTSGTLTFVNGGQSELTFPIETFDDTKFEGDEQIVIRLTNPVDVERGALFQGSVLIDDNDPFDPLLLDDFEQGAFLWDTDGLVEIDAIRSESSDPDARPGQDAVENVLRAAVPVSVDISVQGNPCKKNGVVPVQLLSTPSFDATTVDHTTVRWGDASEAHVDKKTGRAQRHVEDVNRDGRADLVFHFRFTETGLDCGAATVFNGATFDGQAITAGGSDAALGRDFALGQDWTGTDTLDFWYRGAGGGEDVTVTLKDNRAPDPGPSGWDLVWSDEFDDAAGTPPDPANWTHEIGDTTPDAKNGWGNDELQYYTDDPANAATDGNGNLVITLDDDVDPARECYYGPCQFESARLLTQNKAEFAYGRIESRLLVPDGGAGLWPAFWSLGTDITYNPWPGAGEIDIMEYVSRLPEEIFGTVHGPGYAGGASIGNLYDFGAPVYQAGEDGGYHTFTVEWEPNLITWYVDGIQYHQVTPADVPGPWVFDKPFFLLLNFAIGGNFGGAPSEGNTYPQEYAVDYVRVFQGPDTAERFEASFVDDVDGWQRVSVPMTDFVRSADQPAGAPNDGLGLDEVWGYGFALPHGNSSGEVKIDLVERVPVPPPTELVVTTLADSGPGSLREALGLIADGGTITFDPALAGGTIGLTTGQLVVGRSVTIDASAAPGLVVSGSDSSRVLQVKAGSAASVNDLVIANGAGLLQGGGVQNFGILYLDRVVVRDNVIPDTAGPSFEFGGGGIYNGDGATLHLTDSTVADNTSVSQPGGGIYGFFGSTINITRSTVSGNLSGDVAGGLRSLGNATIVNSTFSGNTSTVWHGGGIFHTDGQLTVTNSTFSGNIAPSGTASGILVATFGSPANATLTNNVLEGNDGAFACALEGGGAATITSGGSNVISDGSCNPNGTTDQSNTDALLGALADNGGPTLTHALGAGSPAIDAADAGACPATDQRGVARPQGGGCDVGAVEVSP